MENLKIKNQPLNNVVWRDRNELKANMYNPNKVFPVELELLKTSILEDGWTQPIVITENFEIVDGFHRWTISKDKKIYKMTDGLVPTVMLCNKTIEERMSATIRHNRARGEHGILPMAEIVVNLLQNGMSIENIKKHIGADDEEILRLANRKGVMVRIENVEFGESWKPEDTVNL